MEFLKYILILYFLFQFRLTDSKIISSNIAIKSQNESKSLNLRKVENPVNCGEFEENFLELRATDCSEMPCYLFYDKVYITEIDFILDSDVNEYMQFTIEVIEFEILREYYDGPFEAGIIYTYTILWVTGAPTEEDFSFPVQLSLLDDAENELICLGVIITLGKESQYNPTTTTPAPTTYRSTSTTRNYCNNLPEGIESVNNKHLNTYENVNTTVDDIRLCGGRGEVLDLLIPGCSSQPCILKAEESHDFTIYFRPSSGGNCPHIKQFARINSVWYPISSAKINGITDPGINRLSYDYFADRDARPASPFDLRTSIFINDELEACVEFTVNIII